MRLDSFRFRHVGPFGAEGVCVADLQSGLNVIAEHNERGKSSLLAALEMVLFTPHRSWTRKEKSLQRETGAPLGEVDFTHDGRAYRLRKQFVKSRRAELIDRASGSLLATQREAEERLAAMLGFNPGSQGPSGLLWVRQGRSLDRAEDDGQVASHLETELSTLVGGDRARAYLDRTEKELSALLTSRGPKKGGPLALAQEALKQAESDLDLARAAKRDIQSLSEKLQTVRLQIQKMERQKRSTDDETALKEAQAELDKARIARSELDRQAEQLKRLQAEFDRADEKLQSHLQSVAAFDRADAQRTELGNHLERLCQQDVKAKSQLTMAQDRLAELATQGETLAQMERYRTALDRIAERNQALQAVQANLTELDQDLDRRADHVSRRDALPLITRETYERLQHLSRTIEDCEVKLGALSTTLILDFTPDSIAKIGQERVENGPVTLNANDILDIAGIGTVRLHIAEAGAVRQTQVQAQTELQEMLDQFELASPDSALKIMRERQDISDDIRLIDKFISERAPDGREALIDAHDRIAADIETLSETIADAPDPDAIMDAQALERELDQWTAQLNAAQHQSHEIAIKRTELETELRTLRSTLSQAPETVRGPSRAVETGRLSAATATLKSQMDDLQARLDEARSQIPIDPALIEARIQRLNDASRNRAKHLSQLRTEEATLRARRLQSFEQRDPDAEVIRLEERCEHFHREQAQHQNRADALALLRDTLRDSQKRLQDRYTEPVRRELLPLLRQVIEGADIALDETLGAEGLRRNGTDDAIERLSGGTQEQIAILTRLAFARLLARGGRPCPVILDDALVYADDTRRARMFDVLNYVTGGDDPLQILYLSCHEANALELGGHTISLGSWAED